MSAAYAFVEAEKDEHPVATMCRVLEVSRSAFYEHAKHEPSAREISDAELAERITEIFEEHRSTYGAPRVHRVLRREGIKVSCKRVARLMRRNGQAGRCRRRYVHTTIQDPNAEKLVDLVKRAFGPDTIEVDRCWVGDITYIRTWEGWLYLATVIDLASRKIVGYAMADHMRATLVCDALEMALLKRRPAAGLIFHSDRGSQYTSAEFAALCAKWHVIQSMSRPRQCWDNAVAESFFSTLKTELIYRHTWATRTPARLAVVDYIEGFYNTKRIHSTLGYLSPNEYERRRQIHQPPAADAA